MHFVSTNARLVGLMAIGALMAYAPAAASDGAAARRHLRSSRRTPPRRQLIRKDEDIATRILSSMDSQPAGHFDIEAEADDASTVVLHVDRMEAAVTPETTFDFRLDRQFDPYFAQDLTVLSSNPRTDGQFTLMEVDAQSGDVRGIQRGTHAGDIRQISRGTDGRFEQSTLRARTIPHKALNFTCGVDHSDDHHHHDDRDLSSLFNQHHHHHDASATADRDLAETGHTFDINLVVAVDAAFVDRQGSARAAARYVNFLVNAANVVYEAEVGAHLNVVKVEEVDIFETNEAETLRDGLRIMRQHYEGRVGSGGVDLVHAMLGQDLGGGIAFIDSVCDESWGVGLSSGLRGKINDLNDNAMNDAFVFMHEIGHSLGSGHTFEYDVPIDTCGVDCPAELPLENSATLMSYCNFCEGGLDNVALTLGGVWNGVGSRHDIDAWDVSPELVDSLVSTDPHRVSHHIWTSLAEKQCINPSLGNSTFASMPTSSTPTASPTSSPTSRIAVDNSTSDYNNNTSSPTTSPTDGRRWVRTAAPCVEQMSCLPASGIMFDLEVFYRTSAAEVLVEALQFDHLLRNQTVDLHVTNNGSYVGREHLDSQWSKVASMDVDGVQAQSELVLDAPITMSPGNKRGFYLATADAEDFFLVGHGPTVSFGSGDLSIREGRATFNSSEVNATKFYSAVQAGYSVALPHTNHSTANSSMTMSPSQSPTTQAPTVSPSIHPTTSAPTFTPSVSPSIAPTAGPSASPTAPPTAQPTTLQPSSSPIIDYGPFSIAPESVCDNDCIRAPGYMFSVKNSRKASSAVVITSVSFEHASPKQFRRVELYRTILGSFSGREHKPEEWMKISTLKVPRQKQFDEFVLDTPITLARGEIVGFYLKTEERILIVGKNKRKDGAQTLDGRLQLTSGSAIDGGFGTASEGYSWNGAVTYSTAPLTPGLRPDLTSPARRHQYEAIEEGQSQLFT